MGAKKGGDSTCRGARIRDQDNTATFRTIYLGSKESRWVLTRQERRFYIRHNPGYELRTRGKLRFWTVQVAHPRAVPGAINHGMLDVVTAPRAVLLALLMRSVDAATGAHQPVVVGDGALVTAVHACIVRFARGGKARVT